MHKAFSVSKSQIDKRKKLLEKMQNSDSMQSSSVPFIEEQKQPFQGQAYSMDDGPDFVEQYDQSRTYALEGNNDYIFSQDDTEVPSPKSSFFDAIVNKKRHGSVREQRDEAFTEEISIQVKQRRQSKLVGGFVRKHDRMTFKQDQTKKIERKYVNGTPLLMDLNEIMNLDVISIAMDEQYEQKVRKQKQKVMPEDDDSDPNIYVEETITVLLPTENQDTNEQIITDERQASDYLEWKEKTKIVLDIQYLNSMHGGRVQRGDSDEEEEEDSDESYVSEESANKMAMAMMLSGEHPDAEIDKLLETFGVQVSQIGLIPMQNFFNGGIIENDMRVREELREQIEEVRAIFKNWTSEKTSETTRKLFLMQLAETADALGVSLTVEHLLPGLLDLIQDASIEPAKFQNYVTLLFNELSKLISFMSQSTITVGYTGIRDNLTPLYSDFFLSDLIDDNTRSELQDMAIEQLAMITKVLINEDRIEKVLPIVLELLKDDTDEEKRIIGLELLDVLANDFGIEICQNYLIYEIVSLQDDPVYKVRKETVRRITNISKVVSPEVFIGVLLPVFKKLCTDQIWGVRRQAVETIPEMCMLAPDEIKNGALLDIFKKFTKDQSKWVKQAATQFLGPFIVCYKGLEPSPVLLDFYSEMVQENIKPSGGVSAAQNAEDVLYHCAFNFPAVLHTLGSQSWPQLKSIHTKLVRDSRIKVRKTLSYSLFELAKILGPELTETELISVLLHFLKDVQEVREGVLVSLPEFMAQLSLEQRESYFDKLAQAWASNEESWRKREQKALQIGPIANLMSSNAFQQHYMNHYFYFCEDQVAMVRETATKSCYSIVKLLEPTPEYFDPFMEKLLAFKKARKFSMRQTFIMMCESIIRGDPTDQSVTANKEAERIFQEHFMASFIELQSDKIVNVRLQLSETLALLYEKNERLERLPEEATSPQLSENKLRQLQGPVQKVYSQSVICMSPKIIKMVKRLRVDSHRDISQVLRHINLPTIDNDSDEDEETDAFTPSKFSGEKILLKSNVTKQQAEQSLENEAREVAEQMTVKFLADVYEEALNLQLRGPNEEQEEQKKDSNPLETEQEGEAGQAAQELLEQVYNEVLATLEQM